MRKSMFKTGLIAIAFCASTAHAQSSAVTTGTINDVTGNVLVERGGEFFRAESGSTGLAVGDRVVTVEGSSANINFAGCDLALPDDSSVLILAAPSCAGTFDVTTLKIGDPALDASAASLEIFGLGVLASVLGAAAVIATVVVIADDDDDDDEPIIQPSSP